MPALTTVTGLQLLRRVAVLSRAVSICLAIAPGSVVVVVAHACSALMEVMLAALDAGGVLCPVNWRWSAPELAEVLGRLSPALVLYDSICADLALQAVAAAYPQGGGHDVMGSASPSNTPAPRLCLIDHWHPQYQPRSQQQQQLQGPAAIPLWPPVASIFTSVSSTTSSLLSAASAPAPAPAPALPEDPPAPRPASRAASCHASDASSSRDLRPRQQPPQLQLQPEPQLQLLASPCGTAVLVFTSGTTAAPKGVRLSHSAFHSQSLAKLALVGYSPADTYLHLAPLFHIGGLSSAFATLMAGCAQVFMPRFEPGSALRVIAARRVTAFIAVPAMLQDLAAAAEAATLAGAGSGAADGGVVAAAPTGTPGSPAVAAAGLRCVRRILVGAGGTSPRLQETMSRTFPCAELISAYGMTEACSSMTFRHLRSPAAAMAAAQQPSPAQLWARPGSHGSRCGSSPRQPEVQGQGSCQRRLAGASSPGTEVVPAAAAAGGGVCVGWPAPGVQVTIAPWESLEDARASNSGNAATSSAGCSSSSGSTGAGGLPALVGEVLTRGPHVMVGYWRDPEATAKALSPNGWLHTGDLGYLAEDGGLWLLGRAKDMIKSGGENVFAPQVEAVLCSHKAVAAAAVVGLPDERLGEQVAALVVLRDGWSFDGPLLLHQQIGGTTGPCSAGGSPQAATSLTDMQAHCRAQGLAGFRLPRFAAAQRQPLPVNSSGKVQKPTVREQLTALRNNTAFAKSRL